MEMTTVKSIFRNKGTYIDKEVKLGAWVRKIRSQKNFGFLEINDGSFFNGIQVVFDTSLENFDEISRLSIASSVIVEGTLVKSEGAGQEFEIKASKVEVCQKADLDYPLQNKRHSFEFLRTKSHLKRILSQLFLECDLQQPMQVINFSKNKTLSMYTLQLLQALMRKELEKCSVSQLWT